jgi:hypothetical protein
VARAIIVAVRSWWILCVMAALFACGELMAQDRDALAAALFEQGRAAMKAGDHATACARFEESNRIDPQVGTRFNLARCSEELGKLATAWALYQSVHEELPAGDDRRPIAAARVEALRTRVPRLTLALAPGAPKDTVVRIGETEVTGDGFDAPLPVDPGEVVLSISAPGHAARSLAVIVAVGENQRVEVSPGAAAPEPSPEPLPRTVPSPDAPERPAAPAPAMGAQVFAGWVLAGVGFASILAGVGTGIGGLVEKSKGDDGCSDELMLCSDEGKQANDLARALLTTTTITWIAGVGLAGLGIVLVVTGDDDTEVRVGPGGVTLRRAF